MNGLDPATLGKVFQDVGVPAELVEPLLAEYGEVLRRYYLNDLGPQAVNAGRFCEVVVRILQWETAGTYTPVSSKRLKVDEEIRALERLPASEGNDSSRLHIPRAVRVIYDVRNARNTAHLSDGIDPNAQDASLVLASMKWILAELVRKFHSISADEAESVISQLISRDIPLIEVVDGFPRVLRTLKASDHCLALLYWAGSKGTTRRELATWLPQRMRANLARTLRSLHDQHLVHFADPAVRLLSPGLRHVEASGLLDPL